MLALPHSIDELDFLVNPERAIWNQLYPCIEKEEGWTFMVKDFDHWQNTFGDFWFFVAVEKDTRRPISCIMLALDEASKNGEEPLYTMGFYYTDPVWRDAGVGSVLFWKLMAIVGEDNIGMTSGLHMVSRYITLFGADQISPYIVYRAVVYLKDIAAPVVQKGLVAKKIHDVDWAKVVDYDVSICIRKREKYLRELLNPSGEVFARVILDENDKIVGLGTIRGETGNCLAVGPLYADSKEAARLILDSLIPYIDKKKYNYIHFVYPNCNSDAQKLIHELSNGKFVTTPYLQPQFTKHMIPIDDKKVYSVTDVAMGYV